MITYSDKTTRLTRMMNRLLANTDITDLAPGSIARAFLDIVNEEMEEYYTTLDLYLPMAFLSTASGSYVDALGMLLNCSRLSGEDDDSYKYRISQQVYTTAGANETAIRLKALCIDGVRDAILVPFSYGIGSFSLYVITDEQIVPDNVLIDVQTMLNKEKAAGIRAIADRPILVLVDVSIKLYFKSSTTTSELASLKNSAYKLAKSYLDNLKMGSILSVSKLLSEILASSDNIIDGDVLSCNINGYTTYSKTYQSEWNERVIAGTVTIG